MSAWEEVRQLIGEAAFEEAAAARCEACGREGLHGFYEVLGVPSQTCVLLEDRSEAEDYPTGDILLGFCGTCGFIQNVRFDTGKVDYSMPTEESQAYSPKFNEFAKRLADDLADRYSLAGKTVLEVGCGKGDFLALLGSRGISSGLGIDPGYMAERDRAPMPNLEYRREFYGAGHTDLTADLILTRHLMEHVPNVNEFLGWLRQSAERTPGSGVFTEVPDVERVLVEGAFWDVYYEHCSYFTRDSLTSALTRAGLSVGDVGFGFDGQYLLAHAVPGGAVVEDDDTEEISSLVRRFAARAVDQIRSWRDTIEDVLEGGESVALWGGGSKAAAFVSTIGLERVEVVDINPHKQGRWLPGTSIEVRSPQSLEQTRPALVIPMNAIYVSEIEADLNSMGLTPKVEAL